MTKKTDYAAIGEIVDRAQALEFEHLGTRGPWIDWVLDISKAHKDCPLALELLFAARDADFAHDVFGIRRHINRTTGKLEGCFMPRYAAVYHEAVKAPKDPV